MNAETDFDPAAAERLKKLLRDQFPAAFDTFLSYTGQYIDGIGTALASNDLRETEEIAHKLCSSTAQFGLLRLSREAKAMERGAQEKSGDLQTILTHIHAAFADAKPRLDGWRKNAS